MKNILKSIFIVIFFSSNVLAQSTEPAFNSKDMADLNADSEVKLSTGKQVKQQIRNWFNRKNIIPKVPSKSNKTYYKGTSVVNVSPENRNYPKSLQQAFENAFDKARAEFIFDRVGKQFSDKITESYEDGSSDARNFNPEMCNQSKVESIWNKIVALTDAKLDQALEENGVDPEEYKSTPKTARKELFYEKSIETITKVAQGEIIGLLPVQTFVATGDDGTTSVGVIMVYSPKLIALTTALKNGELPSFTSKRGGKPISYYANKPVNELESMFGPRLVFNEDGIPMVLAYGQWGSSYHGNNARQRERSTDLAFEKADMQASQIMGEFLNGKLESKAEQISGSIVQNFLETDCKSQRKTENEETIDKMSKYLRITGKSKMKGSAVIREWSKVNEFGVETIGAIRMFSYSLYQAHSKPVNEKATEFNSNVKQSIEDSDPEEDW